MASWVINGRPNWVYFWKKNEGLRPLPAPYSLLQFIYICIIIVCVQWRTPMKLWMLTTTALRDLWIQLSEEDRRACPEFWLDYVVRPSKQRLAVVLWTVARGGYDALMENNERGMAGRLDEWIRSNRATWLSCNTFSSVNPCSWHDSCSPRRQPRPAHIGLKVRHPGKYTSEIKWHFIRYPKGSNSLVFLYNLFYQANMVSQRKRKTNKET